MAISYQKLCNFLCLIIIWLFAQGCGNSDNPKTSPLPLGEQLFKLGHSQSELATLKRNFLNITRVTDPARVDRFNVNTTRGPSQQPNTPIIHTYHGVNALAPVVVSFPDCFRLNIPLEIKEQIKQLEVNHLDIFFTPQEEVRQADASLKPAYWMFPNRPHLDRIHGSPSDLQGRVALRLFNSDYMIDNQVVSDRLTHFGVVLHDGLVSPDTGHLNILATPHESFSFYSLAVFEEQRRAAVTLHWMLTRPDREELVNILRAVEGHPTENTFDHLLNTLNQPIFPFYGKPMMRKLLDLVN